jgi:hypothetical protein
MPGLVPGIHASRSFTGACRGHVDGRDKPGHDDLRCWKNATMLAVGHIRTGTGKPWVEPGHDDRLARPAMISRAEGDNWPRPGKGWPGLEPGFSVPK